MSIFNCIGETIKKYGSTVKVKNGTQSINTKAFVEPLRYKNKIYIGGQCRSLGFYKSERYLYVGPAEHALTAESSVIETQGAKYIVKRSETYCVKDSPIYEWAILSPYGEVLEDEYDAD